MPDSFNVQINEIGIKLSKKVKFDDDAETKKWSLGIGDPEQDDPEFDSFAEMCHYLEDLLINQAPKMVDLTPSEELS